MKRGEIEMEQFHFSEAFMFETEEDETDAFISLDKGGKVSYSQDEENSMSIKSEKSYYTALESQVSKNVSPKKPKSGVLGNFLTSSRFIHYQTCVIFLFFNVFALFLDVLSDIALGAFYFIKGSNRWGILTLVCVFLPATFSLLVNSLLPIFQTCKGGKPEKKSPFIEIYYLPLVQVIRNFRIFFGLATMDTINPLNFELVSNLKSKGVEVSATESLLESGPQLLLQMYIFLITGNSNFYQFLCIVISILSLWSTSINLFFTARVKQEREVNPSLRFILSVGPFTLLDILSSLCLVSILTVATEGRGLIAIPIIVGLSVFLGIPLTTQPSALATWIMSGSMVLWSKMKLPLALTTITSIAYLVSITTAIASEVGATRNSIEDYSLLICCPFTEMKGNQTGITLNGLPVLTIQPNPSLDKVVRVCGQNEDPFDVLWERIIPLVVTSLVVKCIMSIILYQLSNFKRLGRFMAWIGGRDFIYLDAFENPEKYATNGQLLKVLSKNLDLINRQDIVLGKTILHLAGDYLTTEQIFSFYKYGANIDVEDLNGRTAKDCWQRNNREKFDQLMRLENEENQISDRFIKFAEGSPQKFRFLIALGFRPDARKNFHSERILDILTNNLHRKRSLELFKNLGEKEALEVIKLDEDWWKLIKEISKELDDDSLQPTRLIHEAAAKGIVNLLDLCSKLKGQNDARDGNGKTALHFASKNGHLDCIKVLLESGASPKIADFNGSSSLHYASQSGHSDCVKLLLECKADPDVQDCQYSTPLFKACQGGHSDCMKILLESKADPNVKNSDGKTPLHISSENGHFDCVKLLLECKADPNVQDSQCSTPLFKACQRGHSDCVKILLELKADPNVKNSDGETPLHISSENGHSGCVKLLLECKADPEVQDSHYSTPLFKACQRGHSDCVKILLQSKADPNVKNSDGKTPLHFSSENGHSEYVKLLLESRACQRGHSDCVKILLESKADPTLKGFKEETPLQIASKNGHSECVKLLLKGTS